MEAEIFIQDIEKEMHSTADLDGTGLDDHHERAQSSQIWEEAASLQLESKTQFSGQLEQGTNTWASRGHKTFN